MTFLDTIGADAPAGDLPPFLSSENKLELATSQHPFWIIGGVPSQEGKFEPQTFFQIKFGKTGKTCKTQTGDDITITAPGWAANVDSFTLALTANDERTAQMTKIKEALALGDVPGIGPCFLHRTKTKSGNDYWKVRGARDEHPLTDAPTPHSNTAGGSKPADDSDGIPFGMSWI